MRKTSSKQRPMSRMIELGPRELNLSVDQWITDTLPPISNSSTSNASASLLSQQQQQQSHQSKIMNVVVPNVACPPAAPKKIRRKPENKPQSQINKCNNEKRRRELENEYIEQLGEFLQINKRDMTACKPDKAAILSEVVKKFRNLLEQRARDTPTQLVRCNKCPPGCSDTCTLHPVQQGEVSSTEPPLPEPSINGHSPEKSAYFEAVQHYIRNVGWALLEINSEGFIEYATENVIDVLHYTRQELSGQLIYNFLHTGDHIKVSPILVKNSFSIDWDQDDGPSFPQTPKHTVRIRWLLKSPEETIEQKQQRSVRYKDLLIISAPVKDDADESSSVLCLITLPEDDQSMDTTMPPANEQLTIRIDAEGKIIKIDTSQLRPHFVAFLAKEIGHKIEELVHPHDHQRLKIHLKEVIHGQSEAQITNYRIKLAPDCFVHSKVQSRMFRSEVQGEPDFVMAVHEILSDSEVMALDGGNFSGMMSGMQPSMSHSLTSHQMQQKHNQGALGGPLMTSVINGVQISQISPRNSQNPLLSDSNNSLLHQPTSNDNYFASFEFDFPSTTFEMENAWGIDSRPDSRASIPSVSTPRPSSATAVFSPATAPLCPSPLTPYHNSQPSPASITNNNNTSMTNNNLTNASAAAAGGSNHNGSSGFNSAGSNSSNNFQFSFEDKEKVQEQLQKMQENNSSSDRLRNLLMKSPSGSGMEQSDQDRARNQILKTLLNAEDDKDNTLTHKFNPSSMSNRMPLQRPRSTTSESKNNNNMLLQLLNDKSDDDESSSKQHSELLKRLQNPMKDDHKEMNNNADMDNEALKKQLRFQGGTGSLENNNRKRASDESDDSSSGTSKRPSKLQEKNKMLASLLACPSRPISSPNLSMPPVRMMPDIPTQIKRLESGLPSPLGNQPAPPNQTAPPNKNNNNPSQKNNNIKSVQQKFRQQPTGQMRNVQGGNVKVGDNVYLTHINQIQHQQLTGRTTIGSMLATSQANSSTSGSFDGHQFVSSSPATTSAPASSSNIQQQTEWDPELNDILENFIEFDEGNFGEDALNFQQMNANANAQLKQQEELAQINKIQQSLMECENEDNFTGSPPAYPVHGLTSQSRLQQGFNQPPPGYNQRNIRLPMNVTSNSNAVSNSNTTTITQATNSQQANKQPNALMLQRIQFQQHQQRLHQLQQKERLLQQQQNQQIVVTAGADQLCLSNSGVQSIDSLLNNTVAPNVTLTSRGAVVTSDSQVSPNYNTQNLMQQLSPSQQRGNTPFSPQANQNFQQSPFNNGGQRLSPQQQQITQQMLNNFQQGNSTSGNNTSQLSPRQPPFTQQSPNPAPANPTNWNQQSATNIRLNLQQNNPMLNAQLSQQQQNVNAFANQRQFSAQRQRSLNSPGTTVSRQNSFNSQESFPEPPSPSASQQQYNSTLFNQQQLRLQRQQSIPQATQHLPGSPRPFGPGLPDGPSGYGITGMNMYNTMGGNDFYSRVAQTGGPNNGNSLNSSQMVRQGLRAVVSGRTQQSNVVNASNANNNANNNIRRNLTSPLDPMGPNGGALGDANTNNNPNNNLMISQQQQLSGNMMNTSADLDSSMRFNFDMNQGTTNVDTKMTASPLATQWSGNSNNSRISLEERAGDQKNSSLLLQKLLSD